MKKECRICNNDIVNAKVYEIKEMMFNTQEVFSYIICPTCGSIQITDIPINLERFYVNPKSIYFGYEKKTPNQLETFLRLKLFSHTIGKKNLIGSILSNFTGKSEVAKWFLKTKTNENTAILDVGCGSGTLLHQLRKFGFKDLDGVDPLIPENIKSEEGIRILRNDLQNESLDKKYGLIMLHHVFEHLTSPLKLLKNIYPMLSDNGILLIRTPVMGKYAWKKYGVNWIQLDAPRHLTIITEKALSIILDQAGFEIIDTEFDSTAFQIWGSDQYLKGVSLFNNKSSLLESPFKRILAQFEEFKYRHVVKKLNETKEGDSACFYIKKKHIIKEK
ncbi:class I SAM-dependent methyltransferase [Emticicia sediminis]